MQDWDMVMSHVIDHAAREHADREIVTRWADGRTSRTNYAAIRHDAKRLAQALRSLGIENGDRVGTLAMNHAHHLVTWYGVAGAGAVTHTINPRLFDDQLIFIANHAEDRVLFYDVAFAPLVERLKPHWNSIEHYICFDDGSFESLLADHDGDCEWTPVDEHDPCMLCYTSGTTGDPKGVLYEHRSNMLHSMAGLQPSIFGFDARSVVLPVVPLFHANAWGLPWAAPMTGTKLVFSAVNEAAVLLDLMEQEGVTMTAGVPTVWMAIFAFLDETGRKLPQSLDRVVIGGSAPPPAMIRRLIDADIEPAHAWGMTETSPVGTVSMLPVDWENVDVGSQVVHKSRQGKAPFGVEIRCVDLDDPSRELPRDGKTGGALQVRGPWVVRRYFKAEEDCTGADQWFATGDVAVIHPDGSLQLTDRTKDLIKSGGEWISSVELENAAAGHPGVAEAVAFGVPDARWTERPVLAVVRKPGQSLTAEDILDFLSDKVARWWLPDTVHFLDEIPHTATGKASKKTLREQFTGD
jgi:fatty-acyl-CoA synthase